MKLEAHCCRLAKSFCNYGYDYARGTKVVLFLSITNQEGATYATEMYTVDCMRKLKDGYCMKMFGDHHRCYYV